ncbi:hypothetical protein HPP92_001305 [Vanilla planifolia]|uniref:Carbohydrate kinase PfkB domain-containing protein n=1 Tax=Vanilla planifolia TaxID=51239 RepID=A0A835VLF2_VANPL|nr:hypothetical protein HPP92_001305 [Vanilla planifolia]
MALLLRARNPVALFSCGAPEAGLSRGAFFSSTPLCKISFKAIANGGNEASLPEKRTSKVQKRTSNSAPVKKKRAFKEKDAALEETKDVEAQTVAKSKVEEEEEDFDEDDDLPYMSPPLICCFGAAQREFVPTVRVSKRQMHPDQYSSWKFLQWNPPEFVRAPGGPASNVAISHCRLGGRAAFMGKVGDDDLGNDLVYKMNMEKVQTRAVKIDPAVRTAASYMRIGFRDDGVRKRMVAETVKYCAEDSFLSSEINVAVLKEGVE